MGPWRFIRGHIDAILTGSGKRYQQEQAEIINDALTAGAISETRRVRLIRR